MHYYQQKEILDPTVKFWDQKLVKDLRFSLSFKIQPCIFLWLEE